MPAVLVAAGLLGGAGYALLKPPSYTASAYAVVVADRADGGPSATNFAQAYGRLAALPSTLVWATPALPPEIVRDARSSVQASTSPDTPLIHITGSAATPARAAAYANGAASALVGYGTMHKADTGVKVALMSPAAVPAAPSSPDLPVDLLIGGATGVLLAALAALGGLGRRPARPRPAQPAAPAGSGAAPVPVAAGPAGRGDGAEPAGA
ncbi:hypothetical protein [Actinomadura parmotrematis]|uniref:Lipopolysaccharide biosynthesis protein n=1 Tax=Actinomadura parmotrematis TaxID=2864039 RepID=A0ABS7G528_9ACTN|nr:hypothetical protein [Actinomadura parmotrematis]MBW8486897.1 hypothetical protein [Actinomadura parmotrematis]